MENSTLNDAQITASSSKDTAYPYRGRLHSANYWSANTADENQWIEVAFYSKTKVTGVILQGRSDADEWVTRYKVTYSLDGSTWDSVVDDNNTVEVKSMATSLLTVVT